MLYSVASIYCTGVFIFIYIALVCTWIREILSNFLLEAILKLIL